MKIWFCKLECRIFQVFLNIYEKYCMKKKLHLITINIVLTTSLLFFSSFAYSKEKSWINNLHFAYNNGNYFESINISQKIISDIYSIKERDILQGTSIFEDKEVFDLCMFTVVSCALIPVLGLFELVDNVQRKDWNMVIDENKDEVNMIKYLSVNERRDLYKIYGISLYNTGKYKKAIIYLEKYMEIEDKFRLTISREDRRTGYISSCYKDIELLIDCYYMENELYKALVLMEKSKAKVMAESLRDGHYAKRNNGKIKSVNRSLAQLELMENQLKFDKESVKRAIHISKKINDTYLNDKFVYLLGLTPVSISDKDMQKFSGKSKLLSLFISEKYLYICLYSHGKYIYMNREYVDKKKLIHAVNKFLDVDLRNNNYNTDNFEYLNNVIFSKIEKKMIGENGSYLIISGHDVLYNLPLSIFRINNDFLVNQFLLSYIPSVSVLNALDKSSYKKVKLSSGKSDVLLVGDVENNIVSSGHLKYAAKEIGYISKMTRRNGVSSLVLSGDSATKHNVLSKLGSSKIVHFATHSFFDLSDSDNSFILVSSSGQDDGRLLAYDLYGLEPSEELEVVYLSSCRSGASELRAGSEPFGLNRSFIMLGAQNVIDTAWEVSDHQAFDIATGFYRYYFSGYDVVKSLNLSLRDNFSLIDLSWASYRVSGVLQ